MKGASPFRVVLTRELYRLFRSPGLWVALVAPSALLVGLLWYLEDAPRSTGDNYSLSLMIGARGASFWLSVTYLPIGFLLTRAYGTRLRQVAEFASSRLIARRTAANARSLALLIVSAGCASIAIAALAWAAPTSLRSKIPVLLYHDMLRAHQLGDFELSFPDEEAADCFEAYQARFSDLPPACSGFGLAVLETTAPFLFLDSDEGVCLDDWMAQGCGLSSRRFSPGRTTMVPVVEDDRKCLETWAVSPGATSAGLAARILHEYGAPDPSHVVQGERRPDPGGSPVGHWVTLVRASPEEQHCADAWASSYAPLRGECYLTVFEQRSLADMTLVERNRADEISRRKPRAFVHGFSAAVYIALSAGLWVLFWSLFGTAVGLRPAGAATTATSIIVGAVACWLGATLGGVASNLWVLGALCLAAYGMVIALWTRSDLD
jgi:hypothetical protein